MQRFQRYDDEGWFRVQGVEVTTSILLAGLTTLSIFLWVISKTVFVNPLWLVGERVQQGQVWRVVTWPLVNGPSLWIILSIAIILMLGTEIERELGKRRFLWLVALTTIVPGIVGSIYPVGFAGPVAAADSGEFGVHRLVTALLIVLVLWRPNSRSFFNIPLWVLIVIFEAIYVLQVLDARAWELLVFWASGVAVAVLLTRAFDLTEFTQIPKIPLPQLITGDPYTKANRAREKAQRRTTKGRPAASGSSSGSGGRKMPKVRRNEPAEVVPIRPEARLDRADQADMDTLLDKISASGIDSLTTDERARLDDLSRRLRGQ